MAAASEEARVALGLYLCEAGAPAGPATGALPVVQVDAECPYVLPLLRETVARRAMHVHHGPEPAEGSVLQWTDYENVDWERVLAGELGASAYCVRKGLCRKAQLWVYVRRFTAKNPDSALARAVPRTWIIDTWEAFEDEMTLNLTDDRSVDVASFSEVRLPLGKRIDACLWEVKEMMEEEDGAAGPWILKPSMFNKGAEIRVATTFEDVRSSVQEWRDIREWVLQRYVQRPLLIRERKFHVRAYVLAVGALSVYLSRHALALTGMEDYSDHDLDNAFAHVTNTARQLAHPTFREEDCVLLLPELPERLPTDRVWGGAAGRALVEHIHASMGAVLGDLFAAYRGEMSVFSPLPRCFELYGVDFLVDQDRQVWLLEVNPGPDLKQTGERLQPTIAALLEDIATVAVDPLVSSPSATTPVPKVTDEALARTAFTRVYDEDWGLAGGPSMGFK